MTESREDGSRGLGSSATHWAQGGAGGDPAPSVTNAGMSNFAKTETCHSFILGMQALQRIAEPADIGSVVAFLASDDARWITGTTIHVDGGSKL